MVWAPTRRTRDAVKFWLDCSQAVTIILGVISAGVVYYNHREDVKRELERPYQEKKLNLYVEASRVLAHLAASPSFDKEKTEARFWELYWGELSFVESQTPESQTPESKAIESQTKDGMFNEQKNPSIESLMVNFCNIYFSPERCSDKIARSKVTPTEKAAIKMAREGSKEIRARWENIGR